ncbi:MAG: transaldolase [Chloroflexi bacterium]|nr:transaldolase [Chloroflexota bacterium]
MSIFLDSAKLDEARAAQELGWVRAVTTNPVLLANSGLTPEETLSELAALGFEYLFYQLTAFTIPDMEKEAHLAREIVGKSLVLKVSPDETGFRFATQNSTRFLICPTAIYSPAQALVARESGARFVALYFNRATRLLGDGIALVRNVAAVLEGSQAEIVAASLKSGEEAVQAFTAGAQHVTVPFDVLQSLVVHQLSIETIDQFRKDGTSLSL